MSRAIRPDGRWLAAQIGPGEIGIWSSTDGKLANRLSGYDGKRDADVVFSRDGERVLVDDGKWPVTIRNSASGQSLAELSAPTDKKWAFTFNASGNRVIAQTWVGTFLWNAGTGALIAQLGADDPAMASALSPNGDLVAVGGHAGATEIRNTSDGALVHRLQGPTKDAVLTVLFSPDGRLLATAVGRDKGVEVSDADRHVHVWDVATGTRLAAFDGHASGVADAWFSADGKRLFTIDDEAVARLWSLPPLQERVDAVKAAATRCLTREQRLRMRLRAQPPAWCRARRLWPFTDGPEQPGWLGRLTVLIAVPRGKSDRASGDLISR